MMNTRLRPLALGLFAVLAIWGPDGSARADRGHPPTVSDARPSEPELNYILMRDGDRISMSGDTKDIERARRLRQGNEALLWFRDGGQEYVLRDPAILKQVEGTWKPVDEIGEAQGKLGSQQGELGRQMGEIGTQQGLLGTRQGTLSVREASLSLREGSDSLSDDGRAQIARQRREIRNQVRALDRQMRALDRPMKELGDKMEVMSREMDVLGHKMEAAAHKAMAEMRAIVKRAIGSGAARPVK
jgi:bla regulator protein BlaR1